MMFKRSDGSLLWESYETLCGHGTELHDIVPDVSIVIEYV
jgi:hypothetical protein